MAKVYCFSATGNSLYVAKRIAEKIGAKVVSMCTEPEICNDDVIGFVFPNFFGGLPKTVEKYVSNLTVTNKNAYLFAVVTYGGSGYGVQGGLQKLLRQKGLSLQYGKNIKSVGNYLPMYEVNDSNQIHNQVDDEVNHAIDDVAHRKQNKIQRHSIVNTIAYSVFPGRKGICDRHFSVSSSCTHCGICQKVCPVNNILVESNKVIFLHHCEHCMACIHACPAHAIEWKKSTQGKKRYRNPHISLNEIISFSQRETGKNAYSEEYK